LKNTILFIFFVLLTSQAIAANLGHRSGGDVFTHLPENSIEVLSLALSGDNTYAPIQDSPEFEYLEFDVWETKDHELVVFHDLSLKRLLPYEGDNIAVYNEMKKNGAVTKPTWLLSIKHLTLEQIKKLSLLGDSRYKVPTLEEYLEEVRKHDLIKPIVLEIKYIKSEEAKEKMIELFSRFKEEYMEGRDVVYVDGFDLPKVSTQFMAFKMFFNLTFGLAPKAHKRWCGTLKENGFDSVSRCMFHRQNLCDK